MATSTSPRRLVDDRTTPSDQPERPRAGAARAALGAHRSPKRQHDAPPTPRRIDLELLDLTALKLDKFLDTAAACYLGHFGDDIDLSWMLLGAMDAVLHDLQRAGARASNPAPGRRPGMAA